MTETSPAFSSVATSPATGHTNTRKISLGFGMNTIGAHSTAGHARTKPRGTLLSGFAAALNPSSSRSPMTNKANMLSSFGQRSPAISLHSNNKSPMRNLTSASRRSTTVNTNTTPARIRKLSQQERVLCEDTVSAIGGMIDESKNLLKSLEERVKDKLNPALIAASFK